MLKNELSDSSNRQIYGLLGAGLLIFVTLSVLAGMPANTNLGAFVTGLVVVFVSLLLVFGITWYLLFKPLPQGLKVSPTKALGKRERLMVAIALVFSGNLGMLGGVWDVAWHASYGVPFGEDFFWRPHQYIYVALFLPILIAGFIAVQTLRNCKGTLQQRFQADIPLSMVMVGGIFMAFVLPADPLWHLLYAEDLTGLSIPHTLFNLVNLVLGIGLLSIFQSYLPARSQWESVLKFQALEIPLLLFSNMTLLTFSMPTIGDWEALKYTGDTLPNLMALVQARPDWSLAAMATFLAVWVSYLANYGSKRYGMATLTLILAMVVRQSLYFIFGYQAYQDVAFWLFIAPIVILLDILTWYGAKRGKPLPSWQMAVLVTIVTSLLSLPQINFTFATPQLHLGNLPFMILASFVAAFLAGWIGQAIGNTISGVKREEQSSAEPLLSKSFVQGLAVLLILIFVFSIWFVTTSVAPIL